MLEGARKDTQSITADWTPTRLRLPEGVRVQEVRPVPKENGWLTEIFRGDWDLGGTVDQVFQVLLFPQAVSAWHTHAETTDRLFVVGGLVKIVLFDAREGSPTAGCLAELRFGPNRPALVTVPPQVWHGVKNLGPTDAIILNLVDQAYRYEDPDHWRLPQDTDRIPYQW